MVTCPAVDVSIIVVTYNSADVVGSSLRALFASEDCSIEVVIVDNASSDRTRNLIRADFAQLTLLANDTNRGFGAANNQAFPLCAGRYLFLLNPDAQVDRHTISRAVRYMDTHPSIGLAGCRITNFDGSPQDSVSYRYPGEKYARGEVDDLPGSIASILGAALIARADLIKRLNGFDEDFFLYGEDQDLCLRARRSGSIIGFVDDAVVRHQGGHSERTFPSEDVWRKKTRAELVFYRKHYKPDTIARIRRANLLKCRWRLATLRAMHVLGVSGRQVKAKIAKYYTIQKTLCEAV